jgi:hypothetical protein
LGTIEVVGSRGNTNSAQAYAQIYEQPDVRSRAAAALEADRSPSLTAIGTRVRLVALAERPGELVAVELESGAFVRARIHQSVGGGEPLDPYTVVDVDVTPQDEVPDPARPEAMNVAGSPVTVARLRRRAAKRLLGVVLLPPGEFLLGFPGPAVSYWTVSGDRPSLALIQPEKGPQLFVRRGEDTVRARFVWGGLEHQLPVEDARLETVLAGGGRPRLSGAALSRALGYEGEYLLVGLTEPRNGHCYKTVIGLLPKP